MAGAAAFDSRSRKYHMQDSLSFCTLEEDMADPNSYFDIALPLQERASGHRQSKSSSDSKEFDFSVCMTPPDFEDSSNISPADELFYKGKLLPLYMSQRLQMSKNLSPEELKKDQSSIAFSCYLHSADVDIDMVLEPSSTGVYGDVDESTSSSRGSSRNSRDKDSSADSSSRDSSEGYEEAPYGFRRSSGASSLFGRSSGPGNLSHSQQVLKNESARFRWKLLLGTHSHRRSSKVMAAGFDKASCGDNVCKSCGQQRKSEASSLSTSERRSLDPFPSSPHFYAGIQPARSCDKFYIPRHSTGGISSGFTVTDASQRRNAYQSVFRAKEFWRKYLKPFISRTSQHRDSYSRPPEDSTLSGEKSSLKSKQRPSRSTTPLASPTHSGVLSAPIDDVQGAIAYCKQSRASSVTR